MPLYKWPEKEKVVEEHLPLEGEGKGFAVSFADPKWEKSVKARVEERKEAAKPRGRPKKKKEE